MFNRRTILTSGIALAGATALPTFAKFQRDNVVIGITLEPPGLDPTVSAAASISEISLYNIYETLTKINSDTSISPLLAEKWDISEDFKTFTFHLRKNVFFHNGEPFNAHSAVFSLNRAKSNQSTNKEKDVFKNLTAVALNEHTLSIYCEEINPDLLFILGQSTAIMVEPKSVANNMSQPVGTGPYQFEKWNKGTRLTLKQWPKHHRFEQLNIRSATFRFVSDTAAQLASLMSGDIDAFPRGAPRNVSYFKKNANFQVLVGKTCAKTIMAINHRHQLLRKLTVRRAISAAIDRAMLITAAVDGFGTPIGSHYTSNMFGYIDTTQINPYDPARSIALLKEAGVKTPLKLRLHLPPSPYARQGAIVITSLLAKVGIQLQIQNVEWAQWLDSVMGKKNYDLTIISHVEPFDLDRYANPEYYWGYDSKVFQSIWMKLKKTTQNEDKASLLAQAQSFLAKDAANVFLYQPQLVTIAKKNLQGLWSDAPVSVNDLSSMSWKNL